MSLCRYRSFFISGGYHHQQQLHHRSFPFASTPQPFSQSSAHLCVRPLQHDRHVLLALHQQQHRSITSSSSHTVKSDESKDDVVDVDIDDDDDNDDDDNDDDVGARAAYRASPASRSLNSIPVRATDISNVTCVRTAKEAIRVTKILMDVEAHVKQNKKKNNKNLQDKEGKAEEGKAEEKKAKKMTKATTTTTTTRFHACDTEVMDIDAKTQGPVGNGVVTCFSIFCGYDVDFGNGPRLYVDLLDDEEEAKQIIDVMRPYFMREDIKKVWHNYSFDRHVLYNMGIDVKGLGADTMHMARLWDSARTYTGGYSLSGLSLELLGSGYVKTPLKNRFGIGKLKKDGTVGKVLTLPPIQDIQRSSDAEVRDAWIDYSTFDAEATYLLRGVLETKLKAMCWLEEKKTNMYDFYVKYWVPFGEMLTDMERTGVMVRAHDYLPELELRAIEDSRREVAFFRSWLRTLPGVPAHVADHINVHSAAQKQQLFFGKKGTIRTMTMDVEQEQEQEKKVGEQVQEEKEEEEEEGKDEHVKQKKTKKKIKLDVPGLGMKPKVLTKAGKPAVTAIALKGLCGTPDKLGAAYEFFGGGEKGKAACEAIGALQKLASIEMMIGTFIQPLQYLADSESRVHCSLNLNTETGRLSARRPNLQNQPALEKDVYKIRDAFTAAPGKMLIVADYGQLELRLLAHITSCKSMIDAFKLGGDFHSRTAMGMYPEVAKAVRDGKVLLELDSSLPSSSSAAARPALLKDVFSSERRRAKVLNFSIAYGKTAFGLAKDFGISKVEAEEVVERWYADRPEVKEWQKKTIQCARATGYTRTLMGRYRPLADINHTDVKRRSHMERAAINTPIQGSAADIVMMAMLKLHSSDRLRALGWRSILQIHDEVILEGPAESTEEALNLVKHIMEHPLANPLAVEMAVDAKADTTWYKAK